MRLNDAILGILIMALGLAILVGATELPGMPGQDVGPSLFPSIIAFGFLGCGAVIGWRGFRRWSAEPAFSVADWFGGRRKVIAGIWLIGGMVIYIETFDIVGFIVLSAVYTGGLMLILGVRLGSAAIWSIGSTVFVFELFTRMLYVPLPGGILGMIG